MAVCNRCGNDASLCEHIQTRENLSKSVKTEDSRENDLAYLESECERLWRIVNSEDLGGPVIPRNELDQASTELDRLQEKLHYLTRRPSCDCKLCRQKGWHSVSIARPSPERSDSLFGHYLSGGLDDNNCKCGDRCLICLDGGCGLAHNHIPERGCICDVCMDEYERLTFGRRFFVIDGVGAISVRDSELAEFLAAYPNAREVK